MLIPLIERSLHRVIVGITPDVMCLQQIIPTRTRTCNSKSIYSRRNIHRFGSPPLLKIHAKIAIRRGMASHSTSGETALV